MSRQAPRSVWTATLAALPAVLIGWVLVRAARGFVGDATWRTFTHLDAPLHAPSPLAAALLAPMVGQWDPLPFATGVGWTAAAVAVAAVALALGRQGARQWTIALGALVLVAWPGTVLWANGDPAWPLAMALSGVACAVAARPPRGRSVAASPLSRGPGAAPLVAGLLWGLAALARLEALPAGLVGAALLERGRRRAALGWALGIAVALGVHAVGGLSRVLLHAPLWPWTLPLAPPLVAFLAPRIEARWGGRRAAAAVLAPALLALALQANLLSVYTGQVDEVARVDAPIGKYLTRHGEPGGRALAVGSPAIDFYAVDLAVTERLDPAAPPTWVVTEGVVADPEGFDRRLERDPAATPPPRSRLLPAGLEDLEGFRPVHTWTRGPTRRTTLWTRLEGPPPSVRTERIPGGMGPPATTEDGTVFHGGVLPEVAFLGEALFVDSYLVPSGDEPAPLLVDVDIWPVGAPRPISSTTRVPGDGLWPVEAWEPGVPVRHRVRVPLPRHWKPGQYYVTWRLRHPDQGPRQAPPFTAGRVQVGMVHLRHRQGRPVWVAPTWLKGQRAPVPERAPPEILEGPTVAVGGDVELGGLQNHLAATRGAEASLAGVEALARADLAWVNLEGVVASSGAPERPGDQDSRVRPETLAVLRAAGVDGVGLGNDRALDLGDEALLEALGHLDEAAIAHAGAGAEDRSACAPVYRPAGRQVVAFFSVDATATEQAATADDPGACWLDISREEQFYEHFASRILTARNMADVVVVAVHWGGRAHRPRGDHRRAARRLIDAGADAIVGSSGGFLQGIEVIDGRPVLYDTGTLLSNDGGTSEDDRSAVFTLILGRHGIRQVRLDPVRGDVGTAVPDEGTSASQTLRRLRDLSHQLGTEVILWDGYGLVDLPEPASRRDPVLRPPRSPLRGPLAAATEAAPAGCVADEVPPRAAMDPVALGPLTLIGATATPRQPAPGDPVSIETWWRVDAPPGDDLLLSLRGAPMVGEAPESSSEHEPCTWAWPTSRWQPGTVIHDRYALFPAGRWAPRPWQVWVGVAGEEHPAARFAPRPPR